MKFLLKSALVALSVWGASYYIPEVKVDSFFTAVIVVLVLSVLNVLVKPVLIILTIPVTIFTLGFFLLVINTIIVLLADALIDGFHIDGIWYSFLFALLLSLVNFLADKIVKED